MKLLVWLLTIAIITIHSLSAANSDPYADIDHNGFRTQAPLAAYSDPDNYLNIVARRNASGCIDIFVPEKKDPVSTMGKPGDGVRFLCPYLNSGVVVIYGSGRNYNLFIFRRKSGTHRIPYNSSEPFAEANLRFEYTSGGAASIVTTADELIAPSASSISGEIDPYGMDISVSFSNSQQLLKFRRKSPDRTTLEMIESDQLKQ